MLSEQMIYLDIGVFFGINLHSNKEKSGLLENDRSLKIVNVCLYLPGAL